MLSIVGQHRGLPLIVLPPRGQAVVTRVRTCEGTAYLVTAKKAGDRPVVVRATTPYHPDSWGDGYYRGVASAVGVAESELYRAVREWMEGDDGRG